MIIKCDLKGQCHLLGNLGIQVDWSSSTVDHGLQPKSQGAWSQVQSEKQPGARTPKLEGTNPKTGFRYLLNSAITCTNQGLLSVGKSHTIRFGNSDNMKILEVPDAHFIMVLWDYQHCIGVLAGADFHHRAKQH